MTTWPALQTAQMHAGRAEFHLLEYKCHCFHATSLKPPPQQGCSLKGNMYDCQVGCLQWWGLLVPRAIHHHLSVLPTNA